MLREAIKRAGGPTRVAAVIGTTRGAIYDFIQRGRVPAEHCPKIERSTNGVVRCEELNPDVDWSYLRSDSSPTLAACESSGGES
jgi:DNA-binding transcriptional regulator YdaS (Cro superfamily)